MRAWYPSPVTDGDRYGGRVKYSRLSTGDQSLDGGWHAFVRYPPKTDINRVTIRPFGDADVRG
ncbi:hypothetical protein GCM10010109_10540 [Actinoplanes campanulatus]|nr:hypothetical protein GCM10010109_10540 [Actinoplanes campanulatus]GID35390.1 hypothetical protein Aca09nite_18960 [Actinoplanes campanulatus]